MSRAVVIGLAGVGAVIASGAKAQQICCVAAPPPPTICCVSPPPPYAGPPAQAAGLRGSADAAYGQPVYSAAQYGGPPPAYAAPQYAPRPTGGSGGGGGGLRGYVGVEYGKSRIEPGPPAERVETWTGEGAVAGQIGQVGVQGDIKVASYNTLGSDDDASTAWSPTVHVYQRNAYGLIGGWAGWSHTKEDDLYGLGLEGQAYFGSATLYGSAGYGHVSNIDQSLWTTRLEGRYFVTENFMLGLNGGLVWSRANGAHTTTRTIGFGAEYQPDILPVSIQASYSHADASGSSVESDTMRIGLRWNFGGGTLAERDRLGPSLNNVTDQFHAN